MKISSAIQLKIMFRRGDNPAKKYEGVGDSPPQRPAKGLFARKWEMLKRKASLQRRGHARAAQSGQTSPQDECGYNIGQYGGHYVRDQHPHTTNGLGLIGTNELGHGSGSDTHKAEVYALENENRLMHTGSVENTHTRSLDDRDWDFKSAEALAVFTEILYRGVDTLDEKPMC